MPLPGNQLYNQLQISRVTLVIAIACLILFTIISCIVFFTDPSFDKAIVKQSLSWENDSLTGLMKGITFLGNHQFLIPANLIVIFFLLIRKENKSAILVLFTSLSSLGWKFLLKDIFHRPRPQEAIVTGIKNFSFPSGHALMSIAFYGLLIIGINTWIKNKSLSKALTIFLCLLILLIGFTRIYLRVHYVTDVLAGFCFGAGWMLFCYWLFTKSKA